MKNCEKDVYWSNWSHVGSYNVQGLHSLTYHVTIIISKNFNKFHHPANLWSQYGVISISFLLPIIVMRINNAYSLIHIIKINKLQ